MSLWDFVGGASRQLLSDRKAEMAQRLKEEEEEKRERNRIVATVPDYDAGTIKEVLAGGETRELPMPEAMQMEGIRGRVMKERERLLQDADRERQTERQKAADERAMRQLEIQERNVSNTASARSEAAARDWLRTEADLRSKGFTADRKTGELKLIEGWTPPKKSLTQAEITSISSTIQRIKDEKVREAAAALFDAGDYEGARSIATSGKVPSSTGYAIQY